MAHAQLAELTTAQLYAIYRLIQQQGRPSADLDAAADKIADVISVRSMAATRLANHLAGSER